MLLYLQTIESPKDKIKFEQIYLKYRRYMFQVASEILQNNQDAEDAVHNAFLSVAKNISKISDLDCPKTRGFLVTIVRSKSIDILRDRKILPDWHEHDLMWCIDQLPSRYRECILLKYSQGYTTKEVAKIMDISFGAASKLDQRAKKRLNELCRREGIL